LSVGGADWNEAASVLTARVLDAKPDAVALDALLANAQVPAFVAGDEAGIAQAAAALGLGAIPAVPQQQASAAPKGTARAWAARAANGKPLVFVLADSPAALAALQRALPHYGRQSWLVFQDDRVVAQGAWPAAVPWVALR
jgi:aminopeptidase N